MGKWLKKGKTWWKDNHQLRLWHTELLGHDEQLVNPAEPAPPAALLKNGRRSGDTVTLTSAGLVSRVQSTFTFAAGLDELVGRTLHVDTRYSRWGGKVSIKAPDPRETTTELCFEGNCHWRLPH